MIRASVLAFALFAASCGAPAQNGAPAQSPPSWEQQLLAEPASNWPGYTISKKKMITNIGTELALDNLGGAVTGQERNAIDDEIRRCMDELWRQQGPTNTVNDLATLCTNGYILSRRMR